MPKFLLFLVFPLFLLASCAGGLTDGERITVSIEPLRYFVEAIGGEKYSVTTLVPSGASPETYELTPQQVVEVSDSRIYFSVGTLGFEKTRLRKLTDNAPHLTAVNLSDSIALMTTDEACCTTDHVHGTAFEPAIDLHTWVAPSSARKMAHRICTALTRLDSLNAPLYASRRDSLIRHIDSVDARIRTILKDLPQRTFLIYHPALGYFARDYGLRQLAVEHNGKEPSAERMQQLIHQARAEGVKVVFIQEEHSGRAARRIAEALGARVVEIAPLSYEWDEQLLHIASSLVP